MSKRTAYNGHFGERKKAKLETSVTDHHFPLSQNPSSSKKDDDWDDDIEDEMLIQVSQVCEQAIIDTDTSFLPGYMAWKQPSSTSTQYQSTPSTSKVSSTNKTPFTFKKPSANPPSALSTHPIASPLPGIANKFIPETKGLSNITDDLVINTNKASGGQEDYVYRQWLQLKEENEKLKSDNDKLLEKCVTKDGEASILRTQLKSFQQAVDNARMEKTRAQENVKMEYTEKLSAVNNQVSDLRTQLEFKTLEIISVKEKFKKMESGKVKLTQVTVPNNDISYRNNCVSVPYDMTQPVKKVRTTSSTMQTENQAPFVKLNKSCTKGGAMRTEMLPQVLEPTQQQHSILEYNENLQKRTDYQHKRTTHGTPSTSAPKEDIQEKDTDNRMHELLACLEKDPYDFGNSRDKCFQLFGTVHEALVYVQRALESTSRSVTTAFLKEMDERYIEASSVFLPFNVQNLLQGRELYKNEQGIRARRLVAAMGTSLETLTVAEMFHQFQEDTSVSVLDTAIRICELIDKCSCGIYYSGFLLSLTYLFETILHQSPARYGPVVSCGARAVVACRGSSQVSLEALGLVRATEGLQSMKLQPLCRRSGGDLKVDYDQGVLLYTKDSCFFQVLLKQTEASLKCIQTQHLVNEALKSMEHLAALYGNISSKQKSSAEEARCQCQVMLVQILVYCLQICATMLTKQADRNNNFSGKHKFKSSRLLGACRSGVRALYQCSLRDAAFLSRLSHYAGHLEDATDRLQVLDRDELYSNMRQELQGAGAGASAGAAADAPRGRPEPWVLSFDNFSVTD